jgi:hypothetical protein
LLILPLSTRSKQQGEKGKQSNHTTPTPEAKKRQ